MLKFPSALKVDTFAKSRSELLVYRIDADSPLCNMKLKELPNKLRCDVLIPIVERGEQVVIPGGDFTLLEKDNITVIATQAKTIDFFKKMGKPTAAARDIMIIGGGITSIYLAKQLLQMGVKVKIIERDMTRCEELAEMLPKAMIIHGDATDKDVLLEEGLVETEAFVANTNFDEENIMLTLFAKSLSKAKLITKVHRVAYDDIIDSLDLGSVIYPKYITAVHIIKYVRAMKNSLDSNIETLYRLNDNRVEVLEFLIKDNSPVVGIPLAELKLKSNVIIGCITHKGQLTIARGQSVIAVGDTVILITTQAGMHDILDALK